MVMVYAKYKNGFGKPVRLSDVFKSGARFALINHDRNQRYIFVREPNSMEVPWVVDANGVEWKGNYNLNNSPVFEFTRLYNETTKQTTEVCTFIPSTAQDPLDGYYQRGKTRKLDDEPTPSRH
jgi:hypothetical protein